MSNQFWGRVVVVSLAIFAMLFGSGNLMFPLKVGLESGEQVWFGFLGFIATAVFLPLLGLLSIISFNGDYRAFFGRLGRIPGALVIFYCMLAIGPLIVMPRIVSLSYTMLKPFLPVIPQYVFAALFLGLVFLATYQPTKLLTVIGRVLSPLKILSVIGIVIVGLLMRSELHQTLFSPIEAMVSGMRYGYGTLDLFGAIFFGSIIVSLLRTDDSAGRAEHSLQNVLKTAFYASFGAALLLGMVYAGMTLLGAYHGCGFHELSPGDLFSAISFKILGCYGAALIGVTVFLACFTTTVSLSAVVSEYVRKDLFGGKMSHIRALLLVLAICMIPASLDLSVILGITLPVIVATYPLFITITVCNALYKWFGVTTIKLPTAVTAIALIFVYRQELTSFFSQFFAC